MAKYLKNSSGQIAEESTVGTSGGAGDENKIPHLDAGGRLDASFMPTGIGADTKVIQASENLAAGDFVNVHNVTGSARVRKADASTTGKEAHGFVKAVVTSGQNATVFFEGANDQVTGQTPGVVYLSTTPGLATTTPPSASGNVVQRIGFAVAAAEINFQSQVPIVLA
jgi:hypothetical protein